MPLFVKAPGQTEGRVDDEPRAQHRHASRRSPTCSARAVFYRQDGRSAFSRAVAGAPRGRRCGRATSRSVVRIGLAGAGARRRASRRRAGRGCSAPAPRARPVRRPVGERLPDRPAPASCSAGAWRRLAVERGRAARSARRRRQRGPVRRTWTPARQVVPDARDRAAPRRSGRRAPRPGGGGERAHPRRRPQLRPRAASARVLLVPACPRASLRRGAQRGRAVRGAARRRLRAAQRRLARRVRHPARVLHRRRRLLAHVDEVAGPAIAGRRAGCRCGSSRRRVVRVGRLEVAAQLVGAAGRARRRGAPPPRAPSPRSRPPPAAARRARPRSRRPCVASRRPGADPVGEHLELGARRGTRARRPGGASRSGARARARRRRSARGCRTWRSGCAGNEVDARRRPAGAGAGSGRRAA